MKQFIWIFIFFLLVSVAHARIEKFQYPSIKDDYCGSEISASYCKCAFHDEYCASISMDSKSASTKVYRGFEQYVSQRIKFFGTACMTGGGIWEVIKKQCVYCENGDVPSKGLCVDPDELKPIEELYNLPTYTHAGGGEKTMGYVTESEGEFFIYSPVRGKWIGPVRKGATLYSGDILHTTRVGRAEVKLGNTHMFLKERTVFELNLPQEKRHILIRGIVQIWDNIKRIAKNEPFEVEGGHSVSGRKGTNYIIEVDDDNSTTFTVYNGIVEVWHKDNPSLKREVLAGESVKVTEDALIESVYEWDDIVQKEVGTDEVLGNETVELVSVPLDPDLINPTENAYSGDLIGNLNIKKSSSWWWIIIILLVGIGVYFFLKKNMKQKK